MNYSTRKRTLKRKKRWRLWLNKLSPFQRAMFDYMTVDPNRYTEEYQRELEKLRFDPPKRVARPYRVHRSVTP